MATSGVFQRMPIEPEGFEQGSTTSSAIEQSVLLPICICLTFGGESSIDSILFLVFLSIAKGDSSFLSIKSKDGKSEKSELFSD